MDVNKKLLSLQEISKSQLSKIFSCVAHTKYIVLEPPLIRPLERVCGVKWLKGNGVEKIFKLETATPHFGTTPVFYMILGSMPVFKQVVDQIRSQTNSDQSTIKNRFHIIVVPKYLYTFEEELEELGLLYSVVRLHSFQWMPLYLDTGVLSLEIPHIYNKLFLQHDTCYLPVLSKILWQLYFVIGKPRFIMALGQYANAIIKQVDLINEDRGETDKIDSEFGSLIIMDRSLDYASALLTPGIYSALLNEVYGVKSGICELKEESTEETDEKFNPLVKKQLVSFSLDSVQDTVYADIKNRYFTEVTSVLSNLTKQLKSEKVNSQEMALDEMKKYVQTQLQVTKNRKKLITNHLLAAETIINVLGPRYELQQEIELNILKNSNKSKNFNYLEEMLITENNKFVSLRLFCLLSITQRLSDTETKNFWKKYLHHFGFKYGFAFRNLMNAEFISEQAATGGGAGSIIQSKIKIPVNFSTSNFHVNANRLKQIPQNPEKINLKFPTCASYVFGGSYISLITQIAGLILNSVPIEEIKTKLEPFGQLLIRNDKGYPLQPRSVLIYVIGGVTYAEIAACNLLETLTGSKIVVLSDRIISGNDLVQDILEVPK